MSGFPLYEQAEQYPVSPLSPMAVYLRDTAHPWQEVEARRKAEIKALLQEWQNGKHPLPVIIGVLDTTLDPQGHPLSHLPRTAQDQESFKDGRVIGGPFDTPEAFQEARKRHIEELIEKNLVRDIAFNESQKGWLDGVMRELDREGSRSVDIVQNIAGRFLKYEDDYWSRNSDYGLAGILKNLDRLRKQENHDRLDHPNDRHLPWEETQKAIASYQELSWTDNIMRDAYQTYEDVELRRSMDIIKAVKRWRDGAHPLLVLKDILGSSLNASNKVDGLISHTRTAIEKVKEARHERTGQRSSESERERLLAHRLQIFDNHRRLVQTMMREMREDVVAYKGPESNPAFAAQLDDFIAQLEDSDQPSLNVVEGLANAMFNDADPEQWKRDVDVFGELRPWAAGAPAILLLRADIAVAREEEEQKWAASKPMGALRTQTEQEIKEPLKAVFNRRANAERPKLTSEIRIDATGAGMIKPYPSGDYSESHEEELYGTTVARITTYSVTFMPKDPERAKELERYVRWGVRKLADIEPAFEIPFDYDSEPYKRPYKSDRWGGNRRYSSGESLHVQVTDDGGIQVFTRLDLDDLFNLYYLLEDIIEPSPQIAAALSAAIRDEERGLLERKDGMRSSYSNRHTEPEEQLGSLVSARPEDYVKAIKEQTLQLHALGEISEEQLLQRMLILAQHTLSGQLVDPSGAYPAYRQLTDQTTPGSALVTYDDALRERTRSLLMDMAGVTDENRPLYPALIKKVANVSRPLRGQFRELARQREAEEWEKATRRGRSSSRSWNEMLEGLQAPEPSKPETEEGKKRMAARANIALRDSPVGPTTDRTWRDTDYVSRTKGSWPRKELPSALRPFMPQSSHAPDMAITMKALTFEGK